MAERTREQENMSVYRNRTLLSMGRDVAITESKYCRVASAGLMLLEGLTEGQKGGGYAKTFKRVRASSKSASY